MPPESFPDVQLAGQETGRSGFDAAQRASSTRDTSLIWAAGSTQAQPAGPVHAVRGTVTPQRDFGTSAGEVYPGSRPVSSVEDLAPATSVQQ